MLAPALLFVGNFVGALLTSAPAEKNAVYSAGQIGGTLAVDLVLIVYVVFAVWVSRKPIAPTLALRRTPLRPTLKWGGIALAVILVANLALDPILHASQRQGIAPTHDPRSTHQWVVLAVAVVVLVLVAPAAEELVFRGLGFASLGRFALPLTTILFADRARASGAPAARGDRRPCAGPAAAEDRIGAPGHGRSHEPERHRARDRAACLVGGVA